MIQSVNVMCGTGVQKEINMPASDVTTVICFLLAILCVVAATIVGIMWWIDTKEGLK